MDGRQKVKWLLLVAGSALAVGLSHLLHYPMDTFFYVSMGLAVILLGEAFYFWRKPNA
jgi:hypothetical protein